MRNINTIDTIFSTENKIAIHQGKIKRQIHTWLVKSVPRTAAVTSCDKNKNTDHEKACYFFQHKLP